MKKEIREKLKKERKILPFQDKIAYAINASEKIFKLEEWKKAKIIKSYMTNESHGELDTSFINKRILEEGKILLLPRINKRTNLIEAIVTTDLTKENFTLGSFGIKEPKGERELIPDLVVVPGIAFDTEGNRIGYGGGYYDKYLNDKELFKIGFLYDFQLVEKIENEEHDVKMDKIIIAKK